MTFRKKLPNFQNTPGFHTSQHPCIAAYSHLTITTSHHLPHFQAHVMFFRPAVGLGIPVKANNLKSVFFIK